jgi:hypothetical protein
MKGITGKGILMSDVMSMINAEGAIKFLNEIHALDPTVLPKLISHRVECNQALADHPTVQVGFCGEFGEMNSGLADKYVVGFMGILNGLFGIRDYGSGYIAYVEENGKLKGFRLTSPSVRDEFEHKVDGKQ